MKKKYFSDNFKEVLFANDISLIHSYDARALSVFFKKVTSKKFVLNFKNNDTSSAFENIYHIDALFLADPNKSIFDLPFLKEIDFEKLLIQYADPDHVLVSDAYQNVKRNMSKFLSSMLNLKDFEDNTDEIKFDYHLEIKNIFEHDEVQANPLLKKLNFLRLLIKLNDFGLFKKPHLFLLENFDLVSSSQYQMEFFQLLEKIKNIKNITLMMDVLQADTFNSLSHNYLFDSFLMYPDFNNEWKFEHFLTHKNWRNLQEEFEFLFRKENNKEIKLKNNAFLNFVLETTNFNFFSSKESVLCFSRKVFFVLNSDKKNKFNLYKLDKIYDLVPIIAIMNSLNQTFKLKIIFKKEDLEPLKKTKFIDLLNKYRIKWTMIDSNKSTSSKNLQEVLMSFIEERQPKLKMDLEQTQTNSIKVIEFIANENKKEIKIENPIIPISSNQINDESTEELEINLEAIIAQQMERLTSEEVQVIYNLNNNGLLYPVVTERLTMFFNSIPVNGLQSETIQEGIFRILKEITKIRLLNSKKPNKTKKAAKHSSSNNHKRTKRWKH